MTVPQIMYCIRHDAPWQQSANALTLTKRAGEFHMLRNDFKKTIISNKFILIRVNGVRPAVYAFWQEHWGIFKSRRSDILLVKSWLGWLIATQSSFGYLPYRCWNVELLGRWLNVNLFFLLKKKKGRSIFITALTLFTTTTNTKNIPYKLNVLIKLYKLLLTKTLHGL